MQPLLALKDLNLTNLAYFKLTVKVTKVINRIRPDSEWRALVNVTAR